MGFLEQSGDQDRERTADAVDPELRFRISLMRLAVIPLEHDGYPQGEAIACATRAIDEISTLVAISAQR
jgi:hypothetical protein